MFLFNDFMIRFGSTESFNGSIEINQLGVKLVLCNFYTDFNIIIISRYVDSSFDFNSKTGI